MPSTTTSHVCLFLATCWLWRGSNAGKFAGNGVVTVDVVVVAGSVPGDDYLVMTVSNSRSGPALEEPESLFVPFRGTFEGVAAPTAAGVCVLPWCCRLELLWFTSHWCAPLSLTVVCSMFQRAGGLYRHPTATFRPYGRCGSPAALSLGRHCCTRLQMVVPSSSMGHSTRCCAPTPYHHPRLATVQYCRL